MAEKNELLYAVPGGLIAVGLQIDPTWTRADKLTGNILGAPGKMPDVINKFKIKFHLLTNLLGVKDKEEKSRKVRNIQVDEVILLNIAACTTTGTVIESSKREATLECKNFICASQGDKLTLSRKIGTTWRLIGWGEIQSGSLS